MVGVGLAVKLLVGLSVGRLEVGLAVGLLVGEGVLIKNDMCCCNSGRSILVPKLKPTVGT